MPELIWNPEWDTGLPLVDQQHRELFALVQAMFQALHRGNDSDLKKMLAFLVNYVEVHFAAEEQAMLKAGYAALDHHKEVHDTLRARVVALDRGQVTDGILDFLVDWLITHINGEDRTMAAFLRAQAEPGRTGPAKGFKRPDLPPVKPWKPRK